MIKTWYCELAIIATSSFVREEGLVQCHQLLWFFSQLRSRVAVVCILFYVPSTRAILCKPLLHGLAVYENIAKLTVLPSNTT